MDLEDKADDGPDIDLAGSLMATEYRLKSTELVPASELGDEDFPQYGDYAPVEERSQVDGTPRGEGYIEVTAELAKWLTHLEDPTAVWFKVTDHEQDPDGRHLYEAEVTERVD